MASNHGVYEGREAALAEGVNPGLGAVLAKG